MCAVAEVAVYRPLYFDDVPLTAERRDEIVRELVETGEYYGNRDIEFHTFDVVPLADGPHSGPGPDPWRKWGAHYLVAKGTATPAKKDGTNG